MGAARRPTGRALGVAIARYKDTKGYAAEVTEVEVDTEADTFRVVRLVAVCDAGAIVNADGLGNQIDGGLIQGLSRTLYEELHLADDGVCERDWTTYGRMRFSDVPDLEVTLLDRRDHPPLGAGEVSTPPVPQAIARHEQQLPLANSDAHGPPALPCVPRRVVAARVEARQSCGSRS